MNLLSEKKTMKDVLDWRNVNINLNPRISCCAGLVELKSLVEKIETGLCPITYCA